MLLLSTTCCKSSPSLSEISVDSVPQVVPKILCKLGLRNKNRCGMKKSEN